MRVIGSLCEDTRDGISTTLRLDRFQDNSPDEVLFYGINCTNNKSIQSQFENYKRKVLLNLWSPCEFTVPDNPAGDGHAQVKFFDEIYTVCPYTAQWMNHLDDGSERHKFIYHPFDYTYIPINQNKIFDVCYFGGLHGHIHHDCIEKIKQFNYRFLSQQSYPSVTNFNTSYKEKMNIVSQCKISICYNYIPLRDDHIRQIKSYQNWKDNKAFNNLDSAVIPQLKARFHEAALCKTLNLVHYDYWNVIENFYQPNKDFYYFNDNSELPYLINNILKSWDYHKQIIESAFNKCLNYGSKETYNLIKEGKTYGL